MDEHLPIYQGGEYFLPYPTHTRPTHTNTDGHTHTHTQHDRVCRQSNKVACDGRGIASLSEQPRLGTRRIRERFLRVHAYERERGESPSWCVQQGVYVCICVCFGAVRCRS